VSDRDVRAVRSMLAYYFSVATTRARIEATVNPPSKREAAKSTTEAMRPSSAKARN
jgi:hypothetical protein